MLRPSLVLLGSSLLLACGGGGGSASVTLKGRVFGESGYVDVDRHYAFGSPEVAPDFNPTIDSHVGTYTQPADAPFQENMTLTVYLGRTFLVGPFDGQVAVSTNSRGTALVGNVKGVVERLEWTGSGSSPIAIEGTFEGTLLGMSAPGGQEELTATDGKFSMRARCDESLNGSRTFLYCGGGVPTKDHTYGAWTVDFDNCPANVRDALLGGLNEPARRDRGSLTLKGRAGSLGCVDTSKSREYCGRNIDEVIDGCRWKGLAAATGNDANALVLFFLRSEESCSGGAVSCNARYSAPVAD